MRADDSESANAFRALAANYFELAEQGGMPHPGIQQQQQAQPKKPSI
jgi:hypothetical protein